jgi:hypothetical protein
MSRSGRTSLSGRSQGQAHVCTDVSQEFCTRTLALLAMFYEPPSAESTAPFPPVKKRDLPPSENRIAFNSAVADLRLRRAYEPRLEAQIALGKQLAARAEEASQHLRTSHADLDELFVPERAPRSVKLDASDDRARDSAVRKAKRTPLQAVPVQENLERMRVATEKGKERARRRIEATERNSDGGHRVHAGGELRIADELAEQRRKAYLRGSVRRNYKSPIARVG